MKLSTLFGIVSILGSVLGCSTLSHSQSEGSHVLLKKHLGESYQVRKLPGGFEARYCPDNTCDVIKAPQTTSQEIMNDFAFIYLARHSAYTKIKEFQKKIADSQIARVMEGYKLLCPGGPPSSTCVLKGMSKKYSISLLFSRFDEGEENLVPMPIE